MVVSAFFLPCLVCGTAFLINFIAIYYHASRAIPFGTMVGSLFLLYLTCRTKSEILTVYSRNNIVH